MAITVIQATPEEIKAVEKETKQPIVGVSFPEMALAHKYLDGLTGAEIGAASHNGFGLEGSVNVAPLEEADEAFYRKSQIGMHGKYAKIDLEGEANAMPFEDDTLDYVISSHVIEHVPNPIGAFVEWNRILKPGGIVFMIFPHREAHPGDVGRPLSTLETFWKAYEEGWSPDQAAENIPDVPGRRRGHYWVMSLHSMLHLIQSANQLIGLNWEILETENVDSKVKNGHTVVARYNGPVPTIQPRDLDEGEMLAEAELAGMNLGDARKLIGNPEAIAKVAEGIADTAMKLNDVLEKPEQLVRKKPGRKAKSS